MILPYQLQKQLATLMTGQDGLDDLALPATERRSSLMASQDILNDLALPATERRSDADDRSGWTR